MPFSRELFLDVSDFPNWAAAAALAVLIATLAHRAGALSRSGAVAAMVVGTIATSAGWSWASILIAYFVTASVMSRFRAGEKEARTGGEVEKGGTRDAAQVAANGAVFAGAALLFSTGPSALWQAVGAAALAASAADTWATEIGTLATPAPRSILDGRVVPAGTSGGVTVLGFLAGLAGAAFIATAVMLVGWPRETALSALIGGVSGCVLDSLLGATLQERRWCSACQSATERRVHRCGIQTERRGGLAWLDNDAVNALATLGGALLGATVWFILR